MGPDQRVRRRRHLGRLRPGQFGGGLLPIAAGGGAIEMHGGQGVDALSGGAIKILVGGLHVDDPGFAAHVGYHAGIQHGRRGRVGVVRLVGVPEGGVIADQAVLGPFRHIADLQQFRKTWHAMVVQHMGDRRAPLAAEGKKGGFIAALILQHQNPVFIQRLVQLPAGFAIDAVTDIQVMHGAAKGAVQWGEFNHRALAFSPIADRLGTVWTTKVLC